MMKRNKLLIFLTSIISVFFARGVSAQNADDIISGMQNVIKIFFGDVVISGGSPGEVFFIKLLVFILLFAIINLVIRRIPNLGDNKAVTILISLIVALIAVRYITTESLVNFIWLPYGVLGVVLTAVFPFVIGFFFIESFDSAVIRKVGWSTYVVIFFGLAMMRWNDFATGKEWYQNLAWMYVIIGILSLILIFFDRQIKNMMFAAALHGASDANTRAEIAKIINEIKKDEEDLAKATDHASRDALRKRIKERWKTIKAMKRASH